MKSSNEYYVTFITEHVVKFDLAEIHDLVITHVKEIVDADSGEIILDDEIDRFELKSNTEV